MKNKIKFTYEPLKDIFTSIAENGKNSVNEIFKIASTKIETMTAKEAWETAIEDANICLNDEDKHILKALGKQMRKN